MVLLGLGPFGACRRDRRTEPDLTAPPPPLVSATAPPVWAPPEAPVEPSAAPSSSPDLAKARSLAEAGEHKKVRALLDKKVRAGKATREEVMVLIESCTALSDKACVKAAKERYPDEP